jgi:hypothetical protein
MKQLFQDPDLPTIPLPRVTEWMEKKLVPAIILLSFAIACLLDVLKPIPHAHSYSLEVRVTAVILVTWLLLSRKRHWIDERSFLWPIFLFGLYFAVNRLLTMEPKGEIVLVYDSLFDILTRGGNPYHCGCIVHFDEYSAIKLGNFNYPPMEIWPYFATYKLAGFWNRNLLTVTLFAQQLLACAILWLTYRREGLWRIGAFVPLISCYELYTNSAQTLLFVALIVAVIEARAKKPAFWQRVALWILFGLGILTKFLIVPLLAVYLWRQVDIRSPKTWVAPLLDLAVPMAIACAMLLPFGIANVFHETILFNLILKDRAMLTTFYPNVVSGPLEWLGVPRLFPVLGLLFLGAAIAVAPLLRLLPAMLTIVIAFLLVSSTPEPQYIPVIIYLALALVFHDRARNRLGQPTA